MKHNRMHSRKLALKELLDQVSDHESLVREQEILDRLDLLYDNWYWHEWEWEDRRFNEEQEEYDRLQEETEEQERYEHEMSLYDPYDYFQFEPYDPLEVD